MFPMMILLVLICSIRCSRYVYEMFYKYKKISREVYQYCLDQKLADAALIAKWKKPGYEKLWYVSLRN